DNTLVGEGSGNATLSGELNTALGGQSGSSLTTGDDNILIGALACSNITTCSSNVMIGVSAGLAVTIEEQNTLRGAGAQGVAGIDGLLQIYADGLPMIHNYPGNQGINGSNFYVGEGAGNFTSSYGTSAGMNNFGFGDRALHAITTGAH